ARQRDQGVAPVGAQEADRLVHSRPARPEWLAQRLVLRLLPAHPDAQAHAAAGQRVERAHLLGHQGRLALGQHQDLGAEGHAGGDRGHVGERHERLEDRHVRVVRTLRPARDRHAHHDVVEDVDVIVADFLDGARQSRHRGRALAIGHAGKLDGQIHDVASFRQARVPYHERSGLPAGATMRKMPREVTAFDASAQAERVGPVRSRPSPAASSPRLLSLDVFRGLTIAAMLLVNNPGTWEHVYPPLEHAAWHGWTPTDLVFPFFLFIVGVATALSLGRLAEAGESRATLFRKALVRAAIIFALGLVLQGFPHYDLPHLRIPGVLQRIAIAYLITATLVLVTGVRGQVLTLAGLLVGYWTLLTLVPVPGVGRPALEPDMNISNWLDFRILGVNHLWAGTRTWDPEGLLSTLGAV